MYICMYIYIHIYTHIVLHMHSAFPANPPDLCKFAETIAKRVHLHISRMLARPAPALDALHHLHSVFTAKAGECYCQSFGLLAGCCSWHDSSSTAAGEPMALLGQMQEQQSPQMARR